MIVDTIKHNGLTIEIHTDDDPESPREWDNLGKILYTSDRYTLGDERVSTEEIKDILARKDVIVLPVFAYIHSGVALSTAPFSCSWDSGQCGIIYVEREAVLKEWSRKRLTKKLTNKIEDILRAEIQTYNEFLSGEVYGYVVKTSIQCGHCGHSEDEELESCWGFYGRDDCIEEAKSVADHCQQRKAG